MARPKKVRPITSAEMLEFIDCATLAGLNVGANMKITIHASSRDASLASALSVYARLAYPLAEVDCLLRDRRRCDQALRRAGVHSRGLHTRR